VPTLRGVAVVVLLTLPGRLDQNQSEIIRVVQNWVRAAQQHQPGTIDRPLLDIAGESPEHFAWIVRHLRSVIDGNRRLRLLDERNDVLRRGALLHTDTALLVPQQAATFTFADVPSRTLDPLTDRSSFRRESDALVFSEDGEYVSTSKESGHWWMARLLLTWILPHPSTDPFVASWYRATTARFERARLFGNAKFHLRRGLEVLPRDPVLLFYAGAMHEAYASPIIQNIPVTRPAIAGQIRMPSPAQEWREAERLFRASVEVDGPVEARVRLGRVLGRLGKHEEAASVLHLVRPTLTDRRLQYFAELFLGSEEGALNHVDQARESLNRAAQLYPTAQSPLLALSELFHRTGNRSAAIDTLRRIARLPADPEGREDPWQDYLDSFASDADDQITAMRDSIDKKEPQ
jgi:hypothetical protein